MTGMHTARTPHQLQSHSIPTYDLHIHITSTLLTPQLQYRRLTVYGERGRNLVLITERSVKAEWQLTGARDGLYTHLDEPARDVTTLNSSKTLKKAGVLLRRASVCREDPSLYQGKSTSGDSSSDRWERPSDNHERVETAWRDS